jgi:hypothetical protein
MPDDGRGILGNWDATGAEIRDALERAVGNAVREHQRAGLPVIVWDRERDAIVSLEPDEIVLNEEQAATTAKH